MAKPKPQPLPSDKIYLEGNKGGDQIEIEKMGDDSIYLKLGHSCVYFVDKIVPVEFLTVAVTQALEQHGSIEGVLRAVGWPKDHVDKMVAKIRKREFGDWKPSRGVGIFVDD